jgi:hypothetical protein
MKGQAAKRPKSLVPVEQIERAILLIRGHKVMVDADLAALYGVVPQRHLIRLLHETSDGFLLILCFV